MDSLSVFFAFFLPATTFAAEASKIAACDQIVAIYNRCGMHLNFDRTKNLISFVGLDQTVACDDGLQRPFSERLNNADLSSILNQKYTTGKSLKLPETRLDYSPGAVRVDHVFKAVYGATEAAVRRNLVRVSFLGHPVQFNKQNGAAAALAAVNDDLMKLYREGRDRQLVDFLEPFISRNCTPTDRCRLENDTFTWRVVAGTTRPSAHSFATAIDLQPATGHEYWLWDIRKQIKTGQAKIREGANPTHLNEKDVVNFTPMGNSTYPLSMVDMFEKHGFIWGGKWSRYDVMHFEYRPEFFPSLQTDCSTQRSLNHSFPEL